MASKSILALLVTILCAGTAGPVLAQDKPAAPGIIGPFPAEQDVMSGDEDGAGALLGRVAVLQLLNKITARTSVVEVRAGTSEKFGNLQIKARDCWKAPPEEKPEVATLLAVSEEKAGEDRRLIFYGWMFASSPAISALEHPVYDIVVLDCKAWKGN